MRVIGKVLDANVVPGRDSYRLRLEVELARGSVYDRDKEKSSYTGMLGEVVLSDVPAGYFDPVPGEQWQPCPADFAPATESTAAAEPEPPAPEAPAPSDDEIKADNLGEPPADIETAAVEGDE